MMAPETRLPELCPGDWTMLDRDQAAEALRIFKANHPEQGKLTAGSVIGIRELAPSFYPGMRLLELLLAHNDFGASLVALVNDDFVTTFNGSSPPLHGLNATGVLKLDTEEDAIGYLCFFCAVVCGDGGAFRNIGSADDLTLHGEADLSGLAIRPHKVIVRPDGVSTSWEIDATVQYSSAIFGARFKVLADGMTEMMDDDPLGSDLPLVGQRFVGGMRVLFNTGTA